MSDISTESAKTVAEYIRVRMKDHGVLQKDLITVIEAATGHGSKGYVSERVNGHFAWSISELDIIAPLIGCTDSFDLMRKAATHR